MTRTETAQETRALLLHAARKQTEEGGYAAASVTAIARRAGLGAGTLYGHFPSKAELFVELFRDVCGGELRAMQDAAAEPAGSSVERLERIVATFARRALQNPRLAWALIAEPVDPLVDAERVAFRADYSRLIAAELHAAITAGELPRQNAELSAAAIVGGVPEALVGPLSPLADKTLSINETVGHVTDFALRAVGAPR
jgi:AcrR family transcriptional regulator